MSQSNNPLSKKPKQKKSEQMLRLQDLIAQLKHENLQLSLSLKKITEKTVSEKHLESVKHSANEKILTQMKIKIQELELTKMAQSQRITKIRQEKQDYQIENGCLNYRIEKLNKQFDDYRLNQKIQFEDLKRINQSQICRYEEIVNEYQAAINQRLEYHQLNFKLQHDIKAIQEDHKRIIADKDRQRLQTIDLLKKQMFEKSKEMKSNLLIMRREQMATNTRLTVLQNHQLLEELEYQSKNIEKLLKKNSQLEEKVKQLTKQLQLQKQIEQELAKRSTISKRIVKSLNEKTISLQKQLLKHTSNIKKANNPDNNNMTNNTLSRLSDSSHDQSHISIAKHQATINILQQQIQLCHSQIGQLKQQKNHFKELYTQNQAKYEYYLKTQNDLRNLMIKFLQSTLEGKVIGEQNEVIYDISRLKGKPIAEWTTSDVQITVKMLLTFVQPHFNMKNMKAQYLKYKNYSNHSKEKLGELLEVTQQSKLPNKYTENQNSSNSHKKQTIGNYHNKKKHSKIKSLSSTALHTRVNSLSKYQKSIINSTGKQFTLKNMLEDYHNKTPGQFEQKKLKKSQSQHYMTSLEKDHASEFGKERYKNGQSKQNLVARQNQPYQEVRLQEFKNKQTKKLVRVSVRDWGKKIQMSPTTSFLA